jgi:hypothetical protein
MPGAVENGCNLRLKISKARDTIRENKVARITLRQLLDHAAEHDYGVPAFNINNMEQGLAIMDAAASVDAPVIIQASRGARSACTRTTATRRRPAPPRFSTALPRS